MPEYAVKWLYRRVVRKAKAGRFYPAISAWGNTGVWAFQNEAMEFQWDELDDDALWKVDGATVARFEKGVMVT